MLLPEVQAQAAQLRPDLLAAQSDQARSLADIRNQLALGKVDWTVGAEYHHQYDNVRANALGFFLSAPLPVFNRNQGEVLRARQESQQLETKVHALQASIANSRQLLNEIETSQLTEAREVRQITEYSYKRGEASLLEYLDAQRAFNDTMQNYNDARSDYAHALYLLDSVSGRGVNP